MRRSRACAAATLAACCLLAPARALAEPPRVIAHRGVTQGAPENSLAACAAAFALRVACEVDLRATREGVLVLMHDANVRRTTTGRGRVAKLRLAELRSLSLLGATGSRVPTLAELLALPRGERALLLDLKRADDAFHAQLARALREARGEIALGVRSAGQARALRALLPRTPQVALIDAPREIERLAAAGAETIRLELAWLARRPELAERVRAAGARLLLFVPGSERGDLRAALAHAPDALLSDAPAAALALSERP